MTIGKIIAGSTKAAIKAGKSVTESATKAAGKTQKTRGLPSTIRKMSTIDLTEAGVMGHWNVDDLADIKVNIRKNKNLTQNEKNSQINRINKALIRINKEMKAGEKEAMKDIEYAAGGLSKKVKKVIKSKDLSKGFKKGAKRTSRSNLSRSKSRVSNTDYRNGGMVYNTTVKRG